MDPNLVLYAAQYADAGTAASDLQALKDAQKAQEFKVVGAVVISSDADGKIDVQEHGPTATKEGAALGAVGGLVVGLFAPPLLLATAVGAGIGAGIGALVKRHDEKEMGVDIADFMDPNTSAIVVVMDDKYADKVEAALVKANKKVSKAVDSGDVDKLNKALTDAGYDVSNAINS